MKNELEMIKKDSIIEIAVTRMRKPAQKNNNKRTLEQRSIVKIMKRKRKPEYHNKNKNNEK